MYQEKEKTDRECEQGVGLRFLFSILKCVLFHSRTAARRGERKVSESRGGRIIITNVLSPRLGMLRAYVPEFPSSLYKTKMELFRQGVYQGSFFLLFPETCNPRNWLRNWQVKSFNISKIFSLVHIPSI